MRCSARATGRSSTASTSRTPRTRSASAGETAYVTAVTQGYKPGDFDRVVINASPCGGCRQWHVEFKVDRVVFANNDGELVEYTPDELLPDTCS